MNTGTKPWWASRTIWSAIGILAAAVISALGGQADDSDATLIGEGVGSIATGVLALIAIWGRVRASRRIGKSDAR